MITVQNLMQMKGQQIWYTSPNAGILDALGLMTSKDIGALPVMDENGLVGIISERDIVRILAEEQDFTPENEVARYMTRTVITTTRESTVEDCMQLMTTHHIRHLPVVEDHLLVGIVSIGDVVKACITDRDETINHLENYIGGHGYGQ